MLPTMLRLGCWWNRSRLGAYADGALESGAQQRRVAAHLDRCISCHHESDRLARLRLLTRSIAAGVEEPDWSGFWPAIQARIAREAPRPIRDSWWLPAWKPFWGHPRISIAGAMAAGLLLTFGFWPGSEDIPVASAVPVVVQDVGTEDADGSVMVYSRPGDVTVIWLFGSGVPTAVTP